MFALFHGPAIAHSLLLTIVNLCDHLQVLPIVNRPNKPSTLDAFSGKLLHNHPRTALFSCIFVLLNYIESRR